MSNFQETQDAYLHEILCRSYELEGDETSLDEQSSYPEETGSPLDDPFYLVDEEDKEILMHRDAHFGGSFDVMIQYYTEEKKGAILDDALERMQLLQTYEQKLNKDLAPLLLAGADAEKVQQAKKMYKDLASVFENAQDKGSIAVQIANLILSEEEDFELEVANIIKLGPIVIPYLIEIVESQALSDPLFPGYSFAPVIAALALGALKAEKAIIPLFEFMNAGNEGDEEAAVYALFSIGEKAKEFLIRCLSGRPLTKSNEQAAYVLLRFQDTDGDKTIAKLFFTQLKDPQVQKAFPLAHYLSLGCEELPSDLKTEYEALLKEKPSLRAPY